MQHGLLTAPHSRNYIRVGRRLFDRAVLDFSSLRWIEGSEWIFFQGLQSGGWRRLAPGRVGSDASVTVTTGVFDPAMF